MVELLGVNTMMNDLILLLISDSTARVVIQEVLERGGYTVEPAGDLGTAVKRLDDCRPALMIVSPYIAEISGYEAARFLRTKCHGLPVLMVAGLIDDDRLEYRLKLEGFDIFPQPYSADALLQKVKEVLAHK